MATENKQIQLWSQTAATWTGSNPTLLNGQIGIESDTLKFKIGNGSTAWTSLAYAGGAITTAGMALLDDATAADQRTTLGAAAASHAHAGSDITSGTVDPARLGSGASITTKFLRGDSTWQAIAGGGDALTTNPLSQFAATTSAQLAGVISDETGSGALVFANTPTLVTPVLGVATATSVNKVALTAPATGATLTLADGSTLTVSASATISNGTHSGTNTGDQTSIVGISGTKAQFDSACSDGNFLFSGDITQYTDEMAQDAVGAMVDSSLVYTDGTPLLQRAALTGDVTASAGSNSTTIANGAVTYAKMQNVSATSRFLGRITSGAGSTEELTGTQATTLLDAFTSSLKGLVPASGGGTTNYLRADGTWAAPAGGGGLSDAEKLTLFGDGSDGDLTVTTTSATSGPITSGSLTRDAYFNNLTVNSSGRILTGGWRLFVKGTLDLTGAPANAISLNANAGGNASGATGGSSSSALGGSSVGGGQAGTAGASGATGAGAKATAVATGNNYHAGTNSAAAGGSGAAGGAGTAGAGGTLTASGSIASVNPIRYLTQHLIRGVTLLGGGEGGTGGSSGAGDAASVSGGGGGGGGEGGRVGGIWAYEISRGGSTAAGSISYKGGNGGNGGNSAGAGAGGTGGGGGGGGGCGGFVYIIAGSLAGSSATNAIDASGGAGGNGGNGAGTGGGGNGGSSGHGGRIHVFDLASNTLTVTNGSAGSAGSAASGTSGGAGAAANTVQANL